mmetsp:Transcript_55060/g.64420  ORF Transcript_55060/g.64420 Transcript_55060/m.64420 type:complete len:135 (+) Transcript_55060:319-723(+)
MKTSLTPPAHCVKIYVYELPKKTRSQTISNEKSRETHCLAGFFPERVGFHASSTLQETRTCPKPHNTPHNSTLHTHKDYTKMTGTRDGKCSKSRGPDATNSGCFVDVWFVSSRQIPPNTTPGYPSRASQIRSSP